MIILEHYRSVIFKQANGTIKRLYKCIFQLNDWFKANFKEINKNWYYDNLFANVFILSLIVINLGFKFLKLYEKYNQIEDK